MMQPSAIIEPYLVKGRMKLEVRSFVRRGDSLSLLKTTLIKYHNFIKDAEE